MMEITEITEVNVRRDLDTNELFDFCGFKTEDVKWAKKLISRNFGGHYLQPKGSFNWHKPLKLKPSLVPKATKKCFDHQVCYRILENPVHTKHLTKSGKRVDAMAMSSECPPEAEKCKMVLINLTDDWCWEDIIVFMHENGLRPSTFYEHMCFVAEHPEQFGEKTAIPFGGYVNPMRYSCSGLTLINKGRFWWTEGGASYHHGENKRAKSVTFTATCVESINTSLFV